MTSIRDKFARLGTDHAPGQELRQADAPHHGSLLGDSLPGEPVDFSHGDVNADAFAPTPTALDEFVAGVHRGGSQAYTEYRGDAKLREQVAERMGKFTGRPVDAANELIITPGTQGALFLALGATIHTGDRVAIVRPDYFANRKVVEFLGGIVVPVRMDYLSRREGAGIDLGQLKEAFRSGVRTFLFSNPNNPTGVVYGADEITAIAELAGRYGVTVIVDQLYSRLLYSGQQFIHLRASSGDASQVVTIMGPSKTESLSGYRLGVAFGAAPIIERMEKLQAIVSLRAPGYSQSVLRTWFAEPEGWLQERIAKHEALRDALLLHVRAVPGVVARTPQAGSYLFPGLPEMRVPLHTFVQALRVQAGAIVTPGTEFSPDATRSVRLNFSQHHARAVAAVQRMTELIVRYAK